MEELSNTAKSYYEAGTPEIKNLARRFFNAMDTDGDGRVDLEEFLTFMSQQGYAVQYYKPQFFKELDKDGNGALDFYEVVTLYYIVNSGRPFCDSCNNFIPETYFSCVKCFNSGKTYNLCRACYDKSCQSHNHDGRSLFLDNYTLLQSKGGVHQPASTSSSENMPESNTSTFSEKEAILIALKAAEIGFYVGLSTGCSIM